MMVLLLYKQYVFVFRCRAVIAADKQHIIDPSVDGGKWHDIVMKCHRDEQPNQPSPPTPPTVGWQKFPGAVVPPNFNKGHIYHYLVETLQAANFDDGDSLIHIPVVMAFRN